MATKSKEQKGKSTTVKDAAKKKKGKLSSPKVKVIVNCSYNNTIVTVTDYNGAVVASSSGGTVGFSGSRKSTAYAATRAGENAASQAMKRGAKEAVVLVKGIGEGRNGAVKGVRASGIKITSLSDRTPIPHGGCRARRIPRK